MPRKGLNTESKISACRGAFSVAFRGGNALHDGFEYFVHPLARAARCGDDFLVAAPQQVGYLVLDLFDHGSLHVYLVDDGDDFEVVSESEIEIGDGLCLYPLRGTTISSAPSHEAMARDTS